MTRWDWYQATVDDAEPSEVVAVVQSVFELADVAPGRPKNGYDQAAEIVRGDTVLADVWWGGNPGVHVKGTGEHSPAVADALQAYRHRPTRVDACLDWVQAGLFDRMAAGLLAYAEQAGLKINQQGDWTRGQARTLYVGAPTSATRLVLYEKGYQVGGDPDWTRLEARVRPQGNARALVAGWQPADAFRASQWLCEALAGIGFDRLTAHAVGTVWRPSDAERARRAMLRQYGATLRAWAFEVGGWEALGGALSAELGEVERPAPLEANTGPGF